MNPNGPVQFYPEHPAPEKTHLIETTPLPLLEQAKPFPIRAFVEEFEADREGFFARYVDKRFEVTGVAKKIGPDAHRKPSIELSDSREGQTFALLIFPTDDHYSKVQVGDTVTVQANYLVMCNRYGIVMKHSRLVAVKKQP